MFYRSQEGREGLSRKGAAALCREGYGEHHRQVFALFFQYGMSRFEGGFGIERIEYGFYKDDIGSTCYQGANLFFVGDIKIAVRHGAEGGIVHVGTHRRRFVGRPHRAGHEYRASGMFGHKGVGRLPCQLGACPVYLFRILPDGVVGHRNGIGIEGIGREDIRPGI